MLTPPACPRPSPLEKEPRTMASTEERSRQLGRDDLGPDHEPDADRAFSDFGGSSVESVASFQVVNDEFQPNMVAEDCPGFETLHDLLTHVDACAG